MEIRPTSNALGAEILDVDLAAVTSSEVDAIADAYSQYGVVFFRDQNVTPEQHLEFARHFGVVNVNRFFTPVDGQPEIAEVRKEPEQVTNIGGGWHTDHSYDIAPAMGSVLRALEVPESGGDTLFASMYAAYESLSDGLKETLGGLKAVHSSRHVFGVERPADAGGDRRIHNPELAVQDAVHPVVIEHPLSGKKALYVNPGFTLRFEGWTNEESKPLLEHLYRRAIQPENTYRFSWGKGSVAFWDNRATWHYALNDYQGQRRLMHRITIEGTTLH